MCLRHEYDVIVWCVIVSYGDDDHGFDVLLSPTYYSTLLVTLSAQTMHISWRCMRYRISTTVDTIVTDSAMHVHHRHCTTTCRYPTTIFVSPTTLYPQCQPLFAVGFVAAAAVSALDRAVPAVLPLLLHSRTVVHRLVGVVPAAHLAAASALHTAAAVVVPVAAVLPSAVVLLVVVAAAAAVAVVSVHHSDLAVASGSLTMVVAPLARASAAVAPDRVVLP